MAGLKKKIATLFGIALISFVICNVQLGIIAPVAIDGAPNSTIAVLKMTEPQCSFDEISSSLESSGQSYCLGTTGDWGGADFIMLLEGLVMVLAGRFKLPKGAGWVARSRKLAMVAGGVLFALAILDRLQLLPDTDQFNRFSRTNAGQYITLDGANRNRNIRCDFTAWAEILGI